MTEPKSKPEQEAKTLTTPPVATRRKHLKRIKCTAQYKTVASIMREIIRHHKLQNTKGLYDLLRSMDHRANLNRISAIVSGRMLPSTRFLTMLHLSGLIDEESIKKIRALPKK